MKNAAVDVKNIFGGVPGEVLRQVLAYIGKELYEAGYAIPGLNEGQVPTESDYRRLFDEKYALNKAVLVQFLEGSEIYTNYLDKSFSAEAWDELIGGLDFDAATEEEFLANVETYISGTDISGKLYTSLMETDKEVLIYILKNIYYDYNKAKEEISAEGGSVTDEILTDVFKGVTVKIYAPNAITSVIEGMVVAGFTENNVYNMALSYLTAKTTLKATSANVFEEIESSVEGLGITDEILGYAVAYGILLKLSESSADPGLVAAADLCRASYLSFNLDGKYVTGTGGMLTADDFARIAALMYADAELTHKAELELAAYYFGLQGDLISISAESGWDENAFSALEVLKDANTENSPENALKDAAYIKILRSSTTADMYEEYVAVRSSLVFELIYRSSEKIRDDLKNIILVSANQTIDNMASSLIGTTSSFNKENVEIYYEIYGEEYSKALGELVLDIYEESVGSEKESISPVIDETLHTMVYEILYDKMSLKENAAAIIAMYREAEQIAASLDSGDYEMLKEFYYEFDGDIRDFVTVKGNLPSVVEEILANETYTKNATLGELTSKETLEYYKALVSTLSEDTDKVITSNLKDEINETSSGTQSVVSALYEEVQAYFSQDEGGVFANLTGTATPKEIDNSGTSSWENKVMTETVEYEVEYKMSVPGNKNSSILSGSASIWRIMGLDTILKNPVQKEDQGTKIVLQSGEAVPAEWYTSSDKTAEPWVKTSYETMAPKTFTITFQYAQENEDYPDDSGKETQAALEAQEKALNEYLQTDEYKALVAEADALVKNQLEEDLEDVRLFLGTLLGTVSVPNNGYYDFPRTSGGKNLTFVNLIEEAANAADLYGYAEKAINALNAWRLERVAENPETATFATFSLQALQYYYNAIKPSENRDYVKQYRQIEALINSVNSLKDVNNLSDLNTADTPKIEEKKKVADNIYEIMNRIKFAEGVTPATPEKVRELVYEYYQLYGNLTDGIWMQEETVKTSKGRTLWKILEDVAAETETLTFEYYGQTIYRLLDRMVEQGKTLNDGTQLRTTEEWYEIVAGMRKSSSEKEKEIFDRVLYTVILYTCMDEATTSEKDKETVISLPNAAETLFMTREELAIFAQIFYDKIKERNGGYYPFDYTLSVYGEFFGTQSDERTSYIAANAESIIGSAVNIQNNATYSSGIAGTRPSVIKANLAQYFVNILASVDGLPTDDGFVKVITDAAKKADDAGLSGDDAGAYSLYVLFNYVYGQNNSVTYPNNDVEMYLTNAWNAYNEFVNGTDADGSGYVINGKTLTWFELLCGRETDKGYVADRNSAFVNAYTFLADKSDYESENTPYDEIYNAVYSDFRTIYSEVMVPGASLSDITGINDIIKKTEGIAYDAQYTDFVKLAKLVAESYDTAVKNLSALDESYGLTEEDIAVYAGMLAVREILCAVYGADSINLTLRGAVSNFAIVKVFSEFTSYVLDTKVGESDYSTIFNMTGAFDATFYDDYILYPNERTGAVKTIFDGITAIQNKEIAFRDAVESYVVNIFVETDALTALFNELNAKLGKDVNSFINENIENGYKAAAEFVGLITSKDYGVTGLTDIVRAVFAGYASETDTPVYLVYKYNRYRNLLSVDFENLYNALNSSADETDKSFVEGYTEIVGGTDLEKALALIELVDAISGQDYEIADGTAKKLYENAYAVINMCYNASTYLTEDMWKSYYGGVSLENLADYFDEAYKAVTSDTTDKALIEALDEATKKELEDAYSLQATSQNDNAKARAMFTLVNVIPADAQFNSVKAKTVIDKAREVLDRCEITEESFDCTATEWRKQYGGPESDYPQIIEALERKTLLENINSGSADKPLEELIEELLGSLEFTDMADYLDEYIDTVKYNARKETNDFAESTEMIERAFAKTYNAAAETRKDIAEIDLGAGVELRNKRRPCARTRTERIRGLR